MSRKKIASATEVMAENIIKANVSMGILNPLANFCMNAAVLIILYLSALRMTSGASAATGGDVLAMIQYVAYIMSGVISAAFAVVMVPHAPWPADASSRCWTCRMMSGNRGQRRRWVAMSPWSM